MDPIVKAWKGQEKLWKVFWLYNFLFGAVITTAQEATSEMHWSVFGIVTVVALAWCVWVVVSLWRGAFNASWRGWGYIVRGIIILAAIVIILNFFIPIEAIDGAT